MITRVVVIFSLAVAQLAAGGQPTPGPSTTPANHSVVFRRVEDTGGYIAVVDHRAFATVEGLKRYIGNLPSGDRVSWWWFGDSSAANPLAQAEDEIRALCEKKGVKFARMLE
ncbi:MAG TPA: hypothetical protein VM940_05040 [Chthoniobacterales bacterium]|nr:hypothetical protein [Chthoniobacterales bacterium]